jgi:uroporphyrinogen decarboxylase
MKQTLKSSLAIIALAVLSTAVQAQTYADYNKRELLWQVLDQSRANDYIPVFFNIHFKDKEGQKAVQSHIDWLRTTHVDFVNVKYEYFPEIQAVKSTKDWKNIKPFAPETWEEQLNVIRQLKRELGNEALIIPTVFSPLRVLIQTAGSQLSSDREGRRHFVEIIKQDPKAIKPALDAVTQSLLYYIREARKAGADGFYISSQGDDLEEFGGSVFNEIIKPYDIQLSKLAAEIAPFNILHICESGGHFTASTLNDYLDYPSSVINPPLHNWQDKGLSLKEISKLFSRPVLGGLNNRSQALKDGNLNELKAEVDEILKDAPANFIFGADDSVPNDVDQEILRKIVDYIHTWRQTHK